MLQAGFNNVIVKVTTKYIRNFTDLLRVAAIQHGSTIEPNDYVNIIGEVVSVPKGISKGKMHKDFSSKDIHVGDTAIFSYQVIATRTHKDGDDEPIYKNRIWYKGQEYFAADITMIFAVIRKDEIRMQNGYVMLEQMSPPSAIILADDTKRMNSTTNAIVSHISEKYHHVKPKDRVYFTPNKLQLYQINGKPFGIIREKDILGKEILSYKEIAMLN